MWRWRWSSIGDIFAGWRARRPHHDIDQFVDLAESTRQQMLRDAEYQRELDAQSRVVRTSTGCRQMARRRVAGVVVRERGRL